MWRNNKQASAWQQHRHDISKQAKQQWRQSVAAVSKSKRIAKGSINIVAKGSAYKSSMAAR